jgi:hypothetical protein
MSHNPATCHLILKKNSQRKSSVLFSSHKTSKKCNLTERPEKSKEGSEFTHPLVPYNSWITALLGDDSSPTIPLWGGYSSLCWRFGKVQLLTDYTKRYPRRLSSSSSSTHESIPPTNYVGLASSDFLLFKTYNTPKMEEISESATDSPKCKRRIQQHPKRGPDVTGSLYTDLHLKGMHFNGYG